MDQGNERGLPPGYTLKPDNYGVLLFLQKDGVTLRQEPVPPLKKGLPISFRRGEEKKAVAFAWWHSKKDAPV